MTHRKPIAAIVRALFLAATTVGLSCQTLSAQPSRTIRLIVPVPPGASTDVVARLMAEHISKARGVTMVVENRPGAGGMIGTEFVSRAAPDGNTLLMTANTYLIDAQMRKASYHPVTAFDPVCLLVESPAVFVVNGASPYRSVNDLLDAARAKPGTLSMAAVGPGSSFQISFINLTHEAKVNMTFIPYQGSAPAVTALLGQHVTSAFAGYAVVAEQMKGGQLRALAAGTSKRTDLLPNLPTFNELGFKNAEADNWFGVNAPAHTPKETLGRLIEWFKTAINDREVRAKIALQGLTVLATCGDEYGALIRRRFDEYGRAIRESNLTQQ
jgi:tripartite-type tricarboxylate transporter receptor subunit TctC